MEEKSEEEKILLDNMVWLRICFTKPIAEKDENEIVRIDFDWTSETAKMLYKRCEEKLLQIRRERAYEENIKHRRDL